MSKVIVKKLKREKFNEELAKILEDPNYNQLKINSKTIDAYVFYSYIDKKGNTIKLICNE